mmetsp:Transcript_3737/g.7135  ORF Transcript_3737/g.7135 Transcript_3737/m.7135 type:complete len:472 (-) Transcript_3737:232-1647(-)|eukprot:CAMPEP_0184684724 /NCGR_PEP_ID=MMETSP0312-20130426/16470_1 /TAXON_ID=31354 /ORGANISM="Compsopogon coeruleus, Strain SAG 36.94" /LENGTH=471 /DNA_ID=CAMNT_0027138209 /DNA_START=357 /DNA_END=1772 /DNA_ORIENTATION=+
MDVETVVSRYRGFTRIQRLGFLASQSPDLEVDALRRAIQELRGGRNAQTYREFAMRLREAVLVRRERGEAASLVDVTEKELTIDEDWIRATDAIYLCHLERLEQDISKFRDEFPANQRAGNAELAELHYERGNLSQARSYYLKAKECSVRDANVLQESLNILRVMIHQRDFLHVESLVNKAEATLKKMDTNGRDEVEQHSVLFGKLCLCSGIAFMVRQEYRSAAGRFLSIPFGSTDDVLPILQEKFGDVASPEDVAIYGGLCVLATFERKSLRDSVLSNADFRNFLELVPEIRELINDFCSSRYTPCLKALKRMREDFSLDLHLSPLVDDIYAKIRSRIIVHYTSPYSSLDVRNMAIVLESTVEDLETELETLIESDVIQARLDEDQKILYRRGGDVRVDAISRTLTRGRNVVNETESHVLRMACIKAGLWVVPLRGGDGERGSESTPMDRAESGRYNLASDSVVSIDESL